MRWGVCGKGCTPNLMHMVGMSPNALFDLFSLHSGIFFLCALFFIIDFFFVAFCFSYRFFCMYILCLDVFLHNAHCPQRLWLLHLSLAFTLAFVTFAFNSRFMQITSPVPFIPRHLLINNVFHLPLNLIALACISTHFPCCFPSLLVSP